MDRPIEVAIGLGGTYLFLSIIVLAINEGVAGFFNRRGMMLKSTLEAMLTGKIAKQLADHPLVTTLASAGKKREKVKFPSYLGPTMFSQAMTELIAGTADAKKDIGAAYTKFLKTITDDNQKKHIQQIVGNSVESVEQLQHRLETWFNNSMDRLSGAYKRRTQWFSRGFATALVFAMNINTIEMTKMLWTNPEVRAAAMKKAQAIVDQCDATQKMTQPARMPPDPMPNQPPGQPQPDVTGAPVVVAPPPQPQPQPPPQPGTSGVQQGGQCPDLIKQTEDMLPLPISGRFWDTMGSGVTAVFGIAFWTTLLGLFLSIWAVSLGAPFWFDTLRKLSGGIQQSGPKPKS